jgi:Uma2 family endonuclease
MASLPKTFLTPEEYLKFERSAEELHEYLRRRNLPDERRIARAWVDRVDIISELRQQLKKRPCEVYPSSMRVRIPNTNRYVYPNVTVVCGEPKFEDEEFDTLLNPTLIIEVLSPSTENYDRGAKLDNI